MMKRAIPAKIQLKHQFGGSFWLQNKVFNKLGWLLLTFENFAEMRYLKF